MAEYRRSLELAADLLGSAGGGDPHARVAAQLNACLRGSVTIYVDTSALTTIVPDEAAALPWEDYHRECGSTHPLEQAYARGRPLAPVTVSDVVSDLAWRRNSSYRSAREVDNSIRQISIPAPGPDGAATGFLVCRPGRDFTAREREFATHVHPLIDTVFRHVAEVRRLERHTGQRSAPADPGLTPRELVVLQLCAEGLTAAATARRLGISVHTVNKHLENSYRKCGTRDRLTTVLLIRQLGLAPRPAP